MVVARWIYRGRQRGVVARRAASRPGARARYLPVRPPVEGGGSRHQAGVAQGAPRQSRLSSRFAQPEIGVACQQGKRYRYPRISAAMSASRSNPERSPVLCSRQPGRMPLLVLPRDTACPITSHVVCATRPRTRVPASMRREKLKGRRRSVSVRGVPRRAADG